MMMATLEFITIYIVIRNAASQTLEKLDEFDSLQGNRGAAINGVNAFEAYNCEHPYTEISSARVSLNSPPECRTEDGSAYHNPQKRKAQILQNIERVSVKVMSCKVNWVLTVG